jgi:Ca2+-binding EF-hand superfamily protein
MMRFLAAGLVAVLGFGWLGVARAEVPAAPVYRFGAAWFAQRDRDNDGRITRAEARAAALEQFAHFDRNADGWVTRAEADASAPEWRQLRVDARFAALDRDRDGALSMRESTFGRREFARADRDRDQRVTPREWWSLRERHARDRDGTAALRSLFWRRDLNSDGRVTRAEVLTFTEQRFVHKDRDGDGALTRAETERRRDR